MTCYLAKRMLCQLCLENKLKFITRRGKNVICLDCAKALTTEELIDALDIYGDDGSLLYYNGQFGVCTRVEGTHKEISTDFGPVYLMNPKTTRVSVVINGIELETCHVECAYYTTIHRLQGLTLTCNLHVDLIMANASVGDYIEAVRVASAAAGVSFDPTNATEQYHRLSMLPKNMPTDPIAAFVILPDNSVAFAQMCESVFDPVAIFTVNNPLADMSFRIP
jgi:hypothetical protein